MFTVSVHPDLTMYSTRVGMGDWVDKTGRGKAKWKTKEEEEKIDPRTPNDHPVLKACACTLYVWIVCMCLS